MQHMDTESAKPSAALHSSEQSGLGGRWVMRMGVCGVLSIAALLFSVPPMAAESPSPLEGVWIDTVSALKDPRWSVEDLICTGTSGCTAQARAYATAILEDERNDSRSLEDIHADVMRYQVSKALELMTTDARAFAAAYKDADDPVNRCVPSGLFDASGPLPLQLSRSGNQVTIRYEYWNAQRTVDLARTDHPQNVEPTRLGNSIGWFDGDTLVVETVGISPHLFATHNVPGAKTSERARGIERYSVSSDGQWLNIETTIIDPVMFKRPIVLVSHRLRADPGFKLDVKSSLTMCQQ